MCGQDQPLLLSQHPFLAFQVFPSLALSCRVVPSFRKDDEQLLSVEVSLDPCPFFCFSHSNPLLFQVTNNRTDRPIDLYVTLDQLSLASRLYRLEILPSQFCTVDQFGNVLQIGWQERFTVHYRLVRVEGDNRICKLSECPFREDAVATSQDCVKSDAVDFLCLERACETFEVNQRKTLVFSCGTVSSSYPFFVVACCRRHGRATKTSCFAPNTKMEVGTILGPLRPFDEQTPPIPPIFQI